MTTVTLASVVDWAGFSQAVRRLAIAGVAPEAVRWRVAGDVEGDLFDAAPDRPDDSLESIHPRSASTAAVPEWRLPKAFVEAAREVFLHADPARWPLLHRLAGRIAADARAWADPLHLDRLQFDRCQREVRREIHKMHAFVRFRRIEAAEAVAFDAAFESALDGAVEAASAPPVVLSDPARHVAWFEPGHHVLEAAAPFFARRFATMRWAILTPRVSARWDGRTLVFGRGAQRADAPPADAGEALWLAYYRSIFNPARVKVAMMKKEMPVRFWKNLPEAAAIGSLLAEAPVRERAMIAAAGDLRERRRGQVAVVRESVEADAATSLDALRRQAARCRDCPVADAATQTVFGEGSADARLMIVGEQPGDQEDLRGRPFQGPAGQLLHGAFAALGWDAKSLWLTNAVKHFHHELRGKRRMHKTPGQQEAEACLHWLDAEIAALRPAAIVALGATAARSLLGRDVGVQANEGQWLTRADGIPVLICLHPAAILRADPSRQAAMRARWIESLRSAGEAMRPDVDAEAVAVAVADADGDTARASDRIAGAEVTAD